MSPSTVQYVPPSAAQLAQGEVLKTSAGERIDGRETMRIVNGDIDASDVVRDLLIYSLFTWRRALPDDKVPPGASRQGWFADPQLGSRLWLLRGAKMTPETLSDARTYAEEALAWLVTDGILASVTVAVSRLTETPDGLVIDVTYKRPDGGPAEVVRFDRIWG